MRRPSPLFPALLALALVAPPRAAAQSFILTGPSTAQVGDTLRYVVAATATDGDRVSRPAMVSVPLTPGLTRLSTQRYVARDTGAQALVMIWNRSDRPLWLVQRVTVRPRAVPPPPVERFAGAAELPRDSVDVTPPAITGATHVVRTAAELHAALAAAVCGDQVVVHPGRYVGAFVLRARCTTGGITVTAAGPIPRGPGVRVIPGDSTWMPTLASPGSNQPTLRTEGAACGYHLTALHVTAQPGAVANTLVAIAGHTAPSLVEMPCRITLDRMLVLGRVDQDLRRCVLLNGAALAVIDSHLGECHSRVADAQAILVYAGPGPLHVEGNRLEGSGEILLLGGADPPLAGVLPRDVVIRRNHFTRPLAWNRLRQPDGSLKNPGGWLVKNLLELKLGQRVLIEGNVFEHNWPDAQTGFALLFKSVNQDGGASWSETSDVVVRCNLIRDAAHGIALAPNPEQHPAVPASRVTIEDNALAVGGQLVQLQGVAGVTLRRNTATSTHSALYLISGASTGLTVTDNAFSRTTYGVFSGGFGGGTSALNGRAPGWTFTGNYLPGVADASKYPPGNTYSGVAPAGIGADSARVAACTAGVVG